MFASVNAHRFCYRLFRISLVSLPLLHYVGLVGLFVVLVMLLPQIGKVTLDPFIRNGLWVVSGLLLLNAIAAYDRGEAFLQLTHFLPFFLLFAVFPLVLQGAQRLEQIATDLVIAAIPINLISLVEYILKSPRLPQLLQETAVVEWIRSAPHKGRAMVTFGHPNALASYLVLILGLGLGLVVKDAMQQRFPSQAIAPTNRINRPNRLMPFIYGGTYLNLVGIFCSGSRNGMLVAISQVALFLLCIKASRKILITGLLSLMGVVASAVFLGIGGRTLVSAILTRDPRLNAWRIAVELMQERPWLGWGLGNYKLLYPLRRLEQDYPHVFHPHNFWLLLGSEAGILVTLTLTAVIGYLCYRGVKSLLFKPQHPSDQAILFGYLLAFWGCVAFALFDVTLYDARINVMNWMLLAGISVLAIAPAAAAPPGKFLPHPED